MKKIKFILSFIIFLVIALVILRNIPFGSRTIYIYFDLADNSERTVEIQIPVLSIDTQNNAYEISVMSFSSKWVVEKEMDKILSAYTKVTCNDKDYYYDKDYDFTITEYEIDNQYLYSTINYKYEFGNHCGS